MPIIDSRARPISPLREFPVPSQSSGQLPPPRNEQLSIPPPSGPYALPSFQQLVSTLAERGHGASHHLPIVQSLSVFDV